MLLLTLYCNHLNIVGLTCVNFVKADAKRRSHADRKRCSSCRSYKNAASGYMKLKKADSCYIRNCTKMPHPAKHEPNTNSTLQIPLCQVLLQPNAAASFISRSIFPSNSQNDFHVTIIHSVYRAVSCPDVLFRLSSNLMTRYFAQSPKIFSSSSWQMTFTP